MDIKKILYNEIDNVGKEKIRVELEKDIDLSKKIIVTILENSIEKIYDNSKDITMDSNFETISSTLAESLLHFLLTVTMYPSQRKITVKNINLDIVIPDLRTLKRYSSKGIIIQFYKKHSYSEVFESIAKIQRNPNNIWSVSTIPIGYNFKYKNYVIYEGKKYKNQNNISLNNFNLKQSKNPRGMDNETTDIRITNEVISNTNLPFSHIIIDINKFLKDTDNKSFKLLPS